MRTFDLLLFDLDGLLIDTEQLHWNAYQQMCLKFGCILTWDFPLYLSIAGGSAHGVQKRIESEFPTLFQGRSWEELYAIKQEILFTLLASSPIPLMPGVKECLFSLASSGKPMVVVTHSPKTVIQMVQQAHPVFEVISRWICREMYKAPKPAPDGYLKACEEMNVIPERAIGFEDSVRGIDSLVAAGCCPVLINGRDPLARKECQTREVAAFSAMTEALSYVRNTSSG